MRGPRAALAALLLTGLLAGCTDSGPESPLATRGTNPSDVADSPLLPCPTQPDTPASGAALLPALSFGCLGGGTYDLGRAPGVPTVVNLWASWCGPCREELPLVQELADLGGDRVRVLGVISQDGVPQAASFADDSGVTLPGAFDRDGEVAAALGLQGLPHTVFLAADGPVAFVQLGPVASTDELRALVAEHLGVQL